MKKKLMIIFSLVLALSVTACAKADEKEIDSGKEDTPVEKPQVEEEKDPSDMEDQDLETSPDSEISEDWPKDFMPKAPVLAGEILQVKEEGPNKRYIELKALEYDLATSYVDSIKEAGFTENANEEINSNIVKYKGMDSDKNLIVFIWKKDITKVELIKSN